MSTYFKLSEISARTEETKGNRGLHSGGAGRCGSRQGAEDSRRRVGEGKAQKVSDDAGE